MPTYEVAGLVLATDLDLPELPPATGEPTWSAERADVLADAEGVAGHEVIAPDGSLFATVTTRADGTYLLAFDGSVDVVIDPATRTVSYRPADGVAERTLRHLLVDQVVPHLFVADGALALHASAVGLDGRAVAFVGSSGAGKSSLAAAFVQVGAPLVADDYLLVRESAGGYAATPAYAGLRLWGDSAEQLVGPAEDLPVVSGLNTKRRWTPPVDGEAGVLPLAAIVILGHQAGADQPVCKIGRIGGQAAFGVLLPQVFRLPSPERADRGELDRIGELIARVPVLLLEFRRDYAVLPEVLDVLRATVARAEELEIVAAVVDP